MPSSSLPAKSRILRFLGTEDRARHAREIASELDISDGVYAGLVSLLDDMVLEGQLGARPGHRYILSKDTKRVKGESVEGYLSMTPRGAGFVTREGGDVYISPESIGGAMHGDKVKVDIRARGTRGPEGEVVEILDRGTKRIAGVLRRRGKSAWLEPDDTRIRGISKKSRAHAAEPAAREHAEPSGPPTLAAAPYGLALPKHSGLAPAVLAAVKALVKSGSYTKILTKWGVQAGAISPAQVKINGATS